jgi:nicotinamide-nucleotide amidase
MNLEIITIGDEILIGQVVDTNSAFMGSELNKQGFEVHRITSISDQRDEIVASLNEALLRVDVVLITGGLGPTRDDITKHVLTEFFNTKLVFNQEVYSDIETLLRGRVKSINDLNKGQAMVPEDCTIIRNPVGTAPVMWFERNGKVVVSMPGVPSEMKHAMIHEVMPRLKAHFQTEHIIHKTVHVFQIPEAVLAEMLSDWEDQMPECIKVAYLPQPGRLRLRLTARGNNLSMLQHAIDERIAKLQLIIGANIFGYDDDTVEKRIGELLNTRNQMVATAESCTGGAIGAAITSVSGSSAYFKGAVVAYLNEVKMNLLKVTSDDLEQYGAVSQQVVEQMALGVQKLLKTDWAIATSGVAGPTGGTPEKPVGTVWIAIANPRGEVTATKYSFGPLRDRNITRTVDTALISLIHEIESYH